MKACNLLIYDETQQFGYEMLSRGPRHITGASFIKTK